MPQLGFKWEVETIHDRECRENKEKGLTAFGYTKTFDGQSKVFYLNGIALTCTVEYDVCSCPHVEFNGEPNVLTETGYRSHFCDFDLKRYSTIEDMIVAVVMSIMAENKRSTKPYTLTWENGEEPQ